MNKNKFSRFLLLWFGGFISNIGSGLTAFGLGVYIYQQTGSATYMSLITLLGFLPSILLSAPAGVLADRYDRRLLMIIGDTFSAVGVLFILICMLLGDVEIWQICVGVTISSVFSSLLQPAYNATISDLLTKDQYTKASGLIQIAGSAKYLVSPILAGLLLKFADIKLVLIIDIATFFITVLATSVVKKGIISKKIKITDSFIRSFKDGLDIIWLHKGIFILVIIGSVICFCLGVIQTLVSPMLLSFSDSATTGVIISISACGMLISSILISIVSIKKSYVKVLCTSLFFSGIFMVMFGFRENVIFICISGFLFFAMLPFANTSIDYLLRINIDNEVQGRVWGLIGIISQMGYIIAYAVCGILADYVFTPLLLDDGALADSVGKIIGTGTGRGIALLIIIAGLLLCTTSIILYQLHSVKALEKGAKNAQ